MSLDILTIISTALLSSFGHCYSMCGGFALAFNRSNSGAKNLFLLNLSYHSARILAYVCLGILFGIFGGLLAFTPLTKSLLMFVLGLFMIILAFSLFFRTKLLYALENNFIFDFYIKKIMKKYIKFKGFKAAFILGFLNGFVPCGLVYFFLASAMSRANVYEAVLIMLVFGVSTLPAMMLLSSLIEMINMTYKKIFNNLSYIIILLYGFYLCYLGFLYL
ncbi:sulfite exporter TauE/SafE family protein [Campylobacter sp. US33a]|uniref:Sulfite exporter TauE/SafE family protein n=1 Tax=Campylobacter sp. CCS1377 TaxID=3158229 RepID=A0AAU7E7N7_9BACT|nr:sulfite exporter TauE/SafE family protein [Campylobacter sp. US33a]MCW1359680.1 sulfite exporter TauE/SafE family protein [Campylobacter jejuni]TEY04498.1 sulfite exporter TauE/SafE family protein [Campylobacter sp. US33a]